MKIWENAGDAADCNVATTTDDMVDNDANGLAHHLNHDATLSKQYADMIRSLDADGFTVGDQGGVQGFNNNGASYEFVAFGAE